jgi:rRNA maturation endonuclease Nob1
MPVIDIKLHNERMPICLECEKLFKPSRTCKECGCFMVIKTSLTESKCPLGKW